MSHGTLCRTALSFFSVLFLVSVSACSKHHVAVTFDLPAEHSLPGVGSVAISQFAGAAGEDAADLLMHSLNQTGPYAVFRQVPLRYMPVADNFHVAADFSGSRCSPFESDAVFYGSALAQAPQISYSAVESHDMPSHVGSDGRYEPTATAPEAATEHIEVAPTNDQEEDEAPPAYTEVDEGLFANSPQQTDAASQEDDLPPPYSVRDPHPVASRATSPRNVVVPPEMRTATPQRQPIETKICRQNSQAVEVTLKVGLRAGARNHLTLVGESIHRGPKVCVVVPGRISSRQAPYYFQEVDHIGMRHAALVGAADALAAKFAPHSVSEQMVLFSDKKITLSKQALAAASSGDWTLAASYYERGIEYAEHHRLKSEQRARVHYNYGIALAAKGDFVQALRHLDLAESIDQNDIYADARVRVARYGALAQQARQQREDAAYFRQTHTCAQH